MDILNYLAKPKDEVHNIDRYQFTKYTPCERDRMNTYGTSTDFIVPCEDIIFDTASSVLIFSGRIVGITEDLTEPNYQSIKLVKNGIMHLYSKIIYLISDKPTEEINIPGYITTFKGLTTFNTTDGCDGWGNENVLDSSGYFSITVELKNIFGIFESYRKGIIRVKQSLRLLRASNDKNCLKVPEGLKDKVKIELSDISWYIPKILPSLNKQVELNKDVSGLDVHINYRYWDYVSNPNIPTGAKSYTWNITSVTDKPRYIIFAMSTDREENITKDNSMFDFCSLEDVYVKLNTTRYPEEDMMIDHEHNYSIAYTNLKNFQKSYFKNDNRFNKPLISKKEFRKSYPIFVIDCSHQNEQINVSVASITLQIKFRNGFPEKTLAHCCIISDTTFLYNSVTHVTKQNY